ncbi:MAG: hypothetical protein QM757_25480 [Paludibaculum sp.]
MFLVNPEYVDLLRARTKPVTIMALSAVGLQMIGYLIIKKIVNIEV